ncbi:MAG TPA: PLP-dependent transferase [Verrucomicrobiota bacterium]|jgi:cystathionine gamma-synthase|nr:PLP-dependent transferase [Verrucomicrobiota bacterium]HRR63845.1 PLP-dependent transferase [Candidatus Paceibacterota bacterium]NLH86208.1 PLP-dependent transferase [Verrucomicrobiota bacterium]HOF70993.1 PLP-dependent transferase [Verrucomicrobiota bacterium]HOM44595.1 PLP-dependent transferase [Verrucomicrobiota bacterium]
MSARDVSKDPVWRGEELGQPIPALPHAVSVALPRWEDVVGYEEKKPEVVNALAGGYPRFFIHAEVRELARQLGDGRPCLPFPSPRAAGLCAEFIERTSGQQAKVLTGRGLSGVVTSDAGSAALRAFWQHTGLIVSSRQAAAHLAGRAARPEELAALPALRRQLAGFYDCAEDDVFLAPTGMAAQFAALQAVRQRTPGRPTAQLGFPYVDTLKLQQKLGHGGILLHRLGSIEQELRDLLSRQPLAACFSEIPGNPLLGSADVRRLHPLLRAQRVPLVVDDVVATPANIDLSGCADLIATSLTKFMVGTGNAMGGALICNPRSPLYAELKPIISARHEELLWGEDAVVLAAQTRSFPERMKRHNQNGLWLAERLRRHPAVERVWYPKWEFAEAYEAVRRPEGGWGALITFLPKEGETRSPGIYDRLEFCKGPSLGTVFTLACPFMLLAHYTELEWAESCGVPRSLIRLSVGLEDPEDLWRRLERALTAR